MVLHRKQRKLAVPNSFYGTVVQIDVGDFQSGGAGDPVRLSNYREPMVLGGDEYLTAAKIADGMITSPVAVGHLGGGATVSQADELMAETDAEGRETSVSQLADGGQCVAHRSRIAWAVGKEEPIGF